MSAEIIAIVSSSKDAYRRGWKRGWKIERRENCALWADHNRILTRETSKEVGPWRTDRTPYLREPLEALSEESPVTAVTMVFGTQLGKALDLETPIPTPSGWASMGTLRVGQSVFDERGLPCLVTHVSPVFHDRDCYRVTFSDGAELIADAQHKWTVDDYSRPAAPERRTLTTAEMAKSVKLKNRHRYAIPVAGPLDTSAAKLPIDPYTLGVWLGDGHSYSAQLSLNVDDADDILERIRLAGYHLRDVGERNHTRTVALDPHGSRDGICHRGHVLADVGTYRVHNGDSLVSVCAECRRQITRSQQYGTHVDPVTRPSFHARLRALGLIARKHIPPCYLRASIAQRLELLRGLMDTDGHIDPRGHNNEIASSHPALAADLLEIIRSLGFKPTVSYHQPKTGKLAARIRFTSYSDRPVYHLPRKRQRLQLAADGRPGETFSRRITAIEPVESRPVRCIAVDSESHLYLAGPAMVPTHNTEVGNNWVGYIIANGLGSILVVQPTGEMGKRWSRQRFDMMLESTPAIGSRIAKARSRDAQNAVSMKRYPGGYLIVGHAESAASISSLPARFTFLDEVDSYPLDTGGEGDSVDLAERRTDSYGRRKKNLRVSSPKKLKGASIIWRLYQDSDQRLFHVPCPKCDTRQALEVDGLLPNNEYLCEHCGSAIPHKSKTDMLHAGLWVPQAEVTPLFHRGYRLPTLYAPVGLGPSWEDLYIEREKAKDDPIATKTFITTRGAMPYEPEGGIEGSDLSAMAEDWHLREPPKGCLLLCAATDVQSDRVETLILGLGRGPTPKTPQLYVVDYHVTHGAPIDPGTWEALEAYLEEPIINPYGQVLPIRLHAVDSGNWANEVYIACHSRLTSGWLPIKGSSTTTAALISGPKPHDLNFAGRHLKHGGAHHIIGTVHAKDTLLDRLAISPTQAHADRWWHLPKGLPDSWYNGMTSERRDPETGRWEKVKASARNEALDVAVYAWAIAHLTGSPRIGSSRLISVGHLRASDWDALEALLCPMQSDLFADQPQAPSGPTAQPQPPSKPGRLIAPVGARSATDRARAFGIT